MIESVGRLLEILHAIELPNNWRLRVVSKDQGFLVQIVFWAVDTNNPGKIEKHSCRKWYISRFMSVTEVVRTVHAAGLMAIQHEFNEEFKYKGVAIANPHRSVDSLADSLVTEHRG